jgi:hypothetical protein
MIFGPLLCFYSAHSIVFMAVPLYLTYTSTRGSFVCDVAAERFFQTNCPARMHEVQAKHETAAITKRGKPVAKLVQ